MKINLLNALSCILLFLISGSGFAQAPNLRTASVFNLFTSVGAIGNIGPTVISGAIGTNFGAMTGFENVNCIKHVQDDITAQCASDINSAFTEIQNIPVTHVITSPLGGTYTPGVYLINSAVILSPTLTLDAQNNPGAIFIFKVKGALTAGLDCKILLVNGASAQNIFWNIDGALLVGDRASVKGTFISLAGAITIGEAASIEGGHLQ